MPDRPRPAAAGSPPRVGGRLCFVPLLGLAVVLCGGCAEPDAHPFELDAEATIAEPEELAPTPEAPEAPCVPETHHVSEGLAVHGCADQVEALLDGGSERPDHADAIASPSDPQAALQGRRLKDCEWLSFIATAKTMMVMCPAELEVVSGGCFSQARMLNSAPFEDDVMTDLPDHGERVQDVTPTSGWTCTYDAPTQTAAQKAAVLCCN